MKSSYQLPIGLGRSQNKMKSKNNHQFKKQNNKTQIYECEVSKASTEIMLYRVCNGYKVDFPFRNKF